MCQVFLADPVYTVGSVFVNFSCFKDCYTKMLSENLFVQVATKKLKFQHRFHNFSIINNFFNDFYQIHHF